MIYIINQAISVGTVPEKSDKMGENENFHFVKKMVSSYAVKMQFLKAVKERFQSSAFLKD